MLDFTVMQFFFFTLVYPFIWLLSKFPMKVLYWISNVLFIFIFYIFKYRKEVVLTNLNLAFPKKKMAENKAIRKQFYKHFADLFVETIKAISISEKEILKRYTYTNPELVKKYLQQGRNIAFVSAHQANWEWSVNSPLILNCNVNGAYTSLGNVYFDKTIKESRQRFGFNCYKSSKAVNVIFKDFKKQIQGIYLLISDQSPQLEHTIYWQNFMGVKVPFHVGAESLAKKFNLVVINCATKKIKRGYYSTQFELIAEHPKEFKDFEITDKYIALTEQIINEQPEYYLWSHNRFKHKNKYEKWLKIRAKKNKKTLIK